MTVHNYDSGDVPTGQTWDTQELQRDYDVIGFAAPYVLVRRKSDNTRGTLQFTHSPRVYWDFQPEKEIRA